MESIKHGGQVQGAPDGWIWRWHQGTAYGMFLRLLFLQGMEQLAEWTQHVHVASLTLVFYLNSPDVSRFPSATSCLEPPFWCLASQQPHLR